MSTDQMPENSGAESCTPDRTHRLKFNLFKTIACWLVVGVIAFAGYATSDLSQIVVGWLAVGAIALVGFAIWSVYVWRTRPPDGGGGNGPPEKELRLIAIDIATGADRDRRKSPVLVLRSTFYPKATRTVSDIRKCLRNLPIFQVTVEAFENKNTEVNEFTQSDFATDKDVRLAVGTIQSNLENCKPDDLDEFWQQDQAARYLLEMSDFGWSDDEGLLYIGWRSKISGRGRGQFLVFRRYGSQYACELGRYVWQ